MSIRKGSVIISGSGGSSGSGGDLPEQAGNAGKFLTTDGSNPSWANVDALPSQTGQSGKILSTNGTTAEWIANSASVEIDNSSITKNSQNKLQASGVIEKNSNTTKYDWIGTYAEWSAGRANNTIDDSWLCFITDDNGTVTSSKERTLGEIIFSLIPLTDPALHLLDGSLLDGTGVYNAFYTYMNNLYQSGFTDCFADENDWQDMITQYGVYGKFVLDQTNQTIRLPKVSGFIEGTLTLANLGDVVEAGLPNITSENRSISFVSDSTNDDLSSGAFIENYKDGYSGLSSYNYRHQFKFDASRSSSIYGNSNTVQPQSVQGFYYIVLSTSVALDVPLDVNAVVNDVTNIQTEISGADYVVEWQEPTSENNYTWYRLYKSGWVEQGGFVASTSSAKEENIVFKIVMKNTYYKISTGVYSSSNHDHIPNYDGYCYNLLTTGMTLRIDNTTNITNGVWWEVKGFAAQS